MGLLLGSGRLTMASCTSLNKAFDEFRSRREFGEYLKGNKLYRLIQQEGWVLTYPLCRAYVERAHCILVEPTMFGLNPEDDDLCEEEEEVEAFSFAFQMLTEVSDGPSVEGLRRGSSMPGDRSAIHAKLWRIARTRKRGGVEHAVEQWRWLSMLDQSRQAKRHRTGHQRSRPLPQQKLQERWRWQRTQAEQKKCKERRSRRMRRSQDRDRKAWFQGGSFLCASHV